MAGYIVEVEAVVTQRLRLRLSVTDADSEAAARADATRFASKRDAWLANARVLGSSEPRDLAIKGVFNTDGNDG